MAYLSSSPAYICGGIEIAGYNNRDFASGPKQALSAIDTLSFFRDVEKCKGCVKH